MASQSSKPHDMSTEREEGCESKEARECVVCAWAVMDVREETEGESKDVGGAEAESDVIEGQRECCGVWLCVEAGVG